MGGRLFIKEGGCRLPSFIKLQIRSINFSDLLVWQYASGTLLLGLVAGLCPQRKP
jgi:hypothetical protein